MTKKQNSKGTSFLEKLKGYLKLHKKTNNLRVLQGLQFKAFKSIYNFLKTGNTEGYVVAPTGFGKTVIISQLILAIDEPAYIIVPRRTLIHQTEHEFGRFAEELEIGKIYSLLKQYNKQVIVMTYESFVRQTEKNKLKVNEIKWLFLDEPHVSLTDMRMATVRKYKNAIKLGFTASHFYSEDKQVSNLLPTEIFNVSVTEAVNEGFLSPFMVIVAETDTDISEVKIIGDDYSQKELAKAINVESLNMTAIQLYQTVPQFWNKSTFIHCVGIRHAETVAELFRSKNISAEAIHSKMSQEVIQDILNDFKKGVIKILCNVDMVSVGFNAPIGSVCFNLRPTKSIVLATQRVRNLRIDPMNPNKFAYVVDFFYKNDRRNSRNKPICYAEIIKETIVIPKFSSPPSSIEGGEYAESIPSEILIEGLKVHTTYDEVFRLISEYKTEHGRHGVGQILSYEEWKNSVIEQGIGSSKEYTEQCKNFANWPTNPRIYPLFPGWSVFFGKKAPRRRTVRKIISYEEWREQVIGEGITTHKQYDAAWPNRPAWPSSPYEIYKDEFPGWPNLVKNTEFLPMSEWIEQVCALGIIKYSHYVYEHKNRKGWPKDPDRVYGMPFFSNAKEF